MVSYIVYQRDASEHRLIDIKLPSSSEADAAVKARQLIPAVLRLFSRGGLTADNVTVMVTAWDSWSHQLELNGITLQQSMENDRSPLEAALPIERSTAMPASQFYRELELYRQRHPGYRRGQAAFNLMLEIAREQAERLRGTAYDPFYNDQVVDRFVTACLGF
jgi:hypothetical protein